ncbi:MAG: phenylalanine--tRNA ligase subunit beta [Clostridia bacterium]|nr:phenylalanine--tRNA ligase subunit beta [Clostridia bacterium]
MKAPLSWLKEYVDIDCSAEELQAKLFSCGFEVEELVHFGANIDKIVTCKIEKIEKHPNADKLSVTQVNAGKYGILQIITAATNIFEGAVVPVALDGSTLFNGEHIYNGELRGLPSFGMFCSGEELGINDDFYKGASVNGILILSDDLPLGEEVKELLNIDDFIFDINVTANRPDCQSILGIAREVAAVLDKPLKMPALDYKVANDISTKDMIKVTNKAFDLCPRYMAHYVSDIQTGESPDWMKKRLFSMGLRSISNIVDITNYVLLEIGQPMHAFDMNELEGNEINIRRADNGEKIVTLDEKEFSLTNDNLVICDAYKPVALAGVMGGLNSGIKEDTKAVVFESARFVRDNIRKTSRMLGQRSDSSARYEKGVDYFSVETGLKRALHLIDELGCGKIACDGYDLMDKPIEQKVIKTTVGKVNAVLGIDVPENEMKNILERLHFDVKMDNGNLTLNVPLYREDMESYPDIAEEIIREYGYDYIKPTLLKTSAITNGGLNDAQSKLESLKNLLIGYNFFETITYSFVPEKDFADFNIETGENGDKIVRIINPLSEDMAVMRRSLVPSMVKAVAFNLNRKNYNGRLFELAKIYTVNPDKSVELPIETAKLCFAMFGENESFFTAKGVVEGILNTYCAGKDVKYVKPEVAYLHPTRSANVFVDGVLIGSFGQLRPDLADKYNVDKPVYICELDYASLVSVFTDKIMFKTISKFPAIERDLAITVDVKVSCAEIFDAINEVGGEFLQTIKLFDVYQGDQVEKGKKSMAFNIVFQSTERTLNVSEIDDTIKLILNNLRNKVNAELR